jgi:hypothetical protein
VKLDMFHIPELDLLKKQITPNLFQRAHLKKDDLSKSNIETLRWMNGGADVLPEQITAKLYDHSVLPVAYL